jgi:hypothetical protein
MHGDNIDWAGYMAEWQKEPSNAPLSVPGDDRTPAWRWIGSLYFDAGLICMPSDNLMTMLREGGAKCKTGKKGGTFKRQTQTGLLIDQLSWPIVTPKGVIKKEDIEILREESDFLEHQKLVGDMGFCLFVKRAKIGNGKHVRVRPRFDQWKISGTITVLDETITKAVLELILDTAGHYCGLCDWRPSSAKSPGYFGQFSAEVK